MPVPPAAGWVGQLSLSFAQRGGTTRLLDNRHAGPLRLLKALTSEDRRTLEAVIVHPPGGMVGGDHLSLRVEAGCGARVLLTTPGAQKWYRTTRRARSEVELSLEAARVDWLPQPTILFDQARVAQHLSIRMDATSNSIGWEILVRGRAAMGESWARGDLEQTLSIEVDARPLWQERLAVDASDRIFASPIGWRGATVAATVWCCAPSMPAAQADAVRDRWVEALRARAAAGATRLSDGIVLARLLADDSEAVLLDCQRLWSLARTVLDGSAPSSPRLWRT